MHAPQKRHHRQRAHSNPFSDHDLVFPMNPHAYGEKVDMLDIGCGYGGMLFKLAETYPSKKVLGMEIRTKLANYVDLKIQHKRSVENTCWNAEVVRTNAMKFVQNYIGKRSIEKMFVLFPDPHFKRKKHKARIITPNMLDIYNHLLAPQGLLYIATDVKELFDHMVQCFENHPGFRRLSAAEEEKDPLFEAIAQDTEESKKAERKQAARHRAVFQCIEWSR